MGILGFQQLFATVRVQFFVVKRIKMIKRENLAVCGFSGAFFNGTLSSFTDLKVFENRARHAAMWPHLPCQGLEGKQ